MARPARMIFPELPHHVTARGNRREPLFFADGDQELYLDLLAEQTCKAKVEIWAYCLMPNHVHLIACPADEVGLGLGVAIGAAPGGGPTSSTPAHVGAGISSTAASPASPWTRRIF